MWEIFTTYVNDDIFVKKSDCWEALDRIKEGSSLFPEFEERNWKQYVH